MREFLFWATLGSLVYAYAGFPLLLLIRGFLQRREVDGAPITPSVTIVIVAHNEAATIESKIGNVYALEYPSERLEVIVASDGSDDGTDELVANAPFSDLRLLICPRAGKIPALNSAVALATGEILVFSDANSMYRPDALRALVAPFADPAVGAVGGNQCYEGGGDGSLASSGERLYWGYDRLLKVMQSRAGSITAATGAMHAIRRHLFRPVPSGVSDDFMISTSAVAAGYRLVFEPRAIAYEAVASSNEAEFRRKLRIIVRGLNGLWVGRELFNPVRHGFYSVQLFSHKLLRWSVCWLLLVLLGSSLILYNDGILYRWAVHAQLLFYAAALAAYALQGTAAARLRVFKVLSIPYYFCLANYAALRAWLTWIGGNRVDVWTSGRSVEAELGGELPMVRR
jgi:cellulose synthase/poly-beta-1,6-N-acetylglucosamine synthase-like glycosyltransferase